MTLPENPATIIILSKKTLPSFNFPPSSNPPSNLSSPAISSAHLNFNFNFNLDPFEFDFLSSTVNPSNPPSHDLLNHPLKKLRTKEGPCSCSSSSSSSSCSSNCPTSSFHSFEALSSPFVSPLSPSPSPSPSTPPPTPFSGDQLSFSLDSWEAKSLDFGKDVLEDPLSSSFPFSFFSQSDLNALNALNVCSSLEQTEKIPQDAKRAEGEEENPLLSPPLSLSLLPEDPLGTPSSLSASDLDEPSFGELPLSWERGEELEEEDCFDEETEEMEENEEGSEEGSEEWTAPRRPRPGLSLTKEEIEMALNCYAYLFSSLKNKKKACQEVGNALKIGSRKVFELVQQRELLVQKGAPINCIPKARIENKRGKAREKAIGEAHLALIRKELSLHFSKSGHFPSASQILSFLGSLPSSGKPVLHLNLPSPGPLQCNLKTLKGHLTKLRREILSSSPSF